MKILYKNLHYPPQAIRDSISGTVYVYLVIDTLGHPTEVKVVRGVRADIDSEAVRCVGLLNEWSFSRQNGQKIKSQYIIPVKFTLSDRKRP